MDERYRKLAGNLIAIAERHTCEGNWSRAIAFLTSGIDLLSGYDNLQARLQARLGDLLWKTGRLPEAEEMLERARILAETADEPITLALILYNLGEVYYIKEFMMRETVSPGALTMHLKALELRQQHGDQIGVIHSLSRVGVIYERLKDDERALECYQRAIILSDEIGYPAGKTRPFTHIGVYHQRQGEHEQALDYFQQALAINRREGCQEAIVFNLINVGRAIFNIEGDLNKALDHCNQALETAESLDFKLAIAQASFVTGSLYESSGDREKARLYFEKLLETAVPLQYRAFIQLAEAKLASLDSSSPG